MGTRRIEYPLTWTVELDVAVPFDTDGGAQWYVKGYNDASWDGIKIIELQGPILPVGGTVPLSVVNMTKQLQVYSPDLQPIPIPPTTPGHALIVPVAQIGTAAPIDRSAWNPPAVESQLASYPAPNLIDGDPSTIWSSANGGASWVEFDMGLRADHQRVLGNEQERTTQWMSAEHGRSTDRTMGERGR
jgi:hypothetical protein